jgi:hypothetical protein
VGTGLKLQGCVSWGVGEYCGHRMGQEPVFADLLASAKVVGVFLCVHNKESVIFTFLL